MVPIHESVHIQCICLSGGCAILGLLCTDHTWKDTDIVYWALAQNALQVQSAAEGVSLQDMHITTTGAQDALVAVAGSSEGNAASLTMERCHIKGGGIASHDEGGAVRVVGKDSSLKCGHCTLHSHGCGLLVLQGGSAMVEHCSVSNCVNNGIRVADSSTLHAAHTRVDGNVCSNIAVYNAEARLEHVSANGCKGWEG